MGDIVNSPPEMEAINVCQKIWKSIPIPFSFHSSMWKDNLEYRNYYLFLYALYFFVVFFIKYVYRVCNNEKSYMYLNKTQIVLQRLIFI